MANYTVQLKGNFDYTQVLNGIKEIKKQLSSIHLGDDIAKELQDSLGKIDLKLPKIESFLNKDQLSGKELEKLQKLIREIENDINNFNKLVENTDLTKTFSSIDLSKIENLDKQIKSIQDKIQVARQELIDTFTKEIKIDTKNDIVQKAITDLFSVEPSQVKDKFQEIQTTIESQLQETENKIKELTDDDISSGPKIIKALFGDESTVSITKGKVTEFKTQLGELVQQFKDLTPGTEEARNKLKEIFDLINNYTKNKNNEKILQGPSPEDLEAVSQLENSLKRIEELSTTKEEFFDENEAEKIKVLEERIKLLEERIKELEKLQPNLKSETKKLANEFEILGDDARNAAEEERRLEAQQKALDATFGGLIHRVESAVSAMAIFNKGMQITRNAIQSVKDLDAAFTQIAIVSEQSGEQAWKLFDEFNRLAKQYSITTKDLTEGAKLFYQQGLNAADTMKMVEASTVSAALGEVTMTEAANTLTAAIQGYNESAAVAMDYTDKIAKVGAVSAADFNELSASMEKTASSAYTAGIDFDHLLGYLGKMIEVTREAPRKYYKNIIFSENLYI